MKIGNGTGFKIVQAVLYALAVVLFVTLGIVYGIKAADYMGIVIDYNDKGGKVYVNRYSLDGEEYQGDNGTSNGETWYSIITYGDGIKPRFELKTRDDENNIIEGVYDYVRGDNREELLYFSNGEETVTIEYNSFPGYYLMDEYKAFGTVFPIIGGIFAVVEILHLIATFKGRKSRGANVLGIVVNMPFALCPFGLCGLIGCIKGRMYLQFTQSGCAAGASGTAVKQTAEVRAQDITGASEMGGSEESAAADAQTAEAGVESSARTQEKREIKKSEFTLDLYDASIDEKTWKEFKKTATQEELAVIAIGAKYRVAHSRVKNILFTFGIILSVALFWPTGGYSLIGYPVFAFLATKSIRYEDTLSQAYRKLNKEYKELVDGYYNCGVGWKILDVFIKLGVFYVTIPYQAIMLFIGTFAPNFVVSKNGILVSIPKGYDVGNLGAVGAYYQGFKFIDEALDNNKKYTGTAVVDGYEVAVHSADDRTYYDGNGNCYVKEGGKLIKK